MTEVERVRDLARDVIPAGQPSVANLVTVVTRLGALSETLTSLAANGAHWWEPRHASLWARAIERVGSLTLPSGRPQYTWWADLLRYPAQLMMYAAGIVCSASRNDDALAAILLTPHFADTQGRQRPAASALNNSIYSDFEKQLPGRERQFMPWCEHLFEVLEPVVAPFLSNPSTYKTAFERFELITALSAVHGLGHEDARYASFPVGRAWYMRHNVYPRSESQVDRLGEEIRASGAAWPLLRHGLFGGSVDRLNAMYAELDTQTQRRLT